jgi:hypothetical protein
MARIICLANSYKHGGRCIAGIDVDSGKWIRPVPDGNGGAVTSTVRLIDGKEPQILDVIDIPILDSGPDEGCQPENRTLKSGKWKKVGQITAQDLLQYCGDDSVVLHNDLKYVSPDFFTTLPKSEWQSLQLVHNSNVRFGSAYKPDQWQVAFKDGNGHSLVLKLTDPIISDKLRRSEKISKNCILTVSLATPWSPQGSTKPKLCYKMIAGVVEL